MAYDKATRRSTMKVGKRKKKVVRKKPKPLKRLKRGSKKMKSRRLGRGDYPKPGKPLSQRSKNY